MPPFGSFHWPRKIAIEVGWTSQSAGGVKISTGGAAAAGAPLVVGGVGAFMQAVTSRRAASGSTAAGTAARGSKEERTPMRGSLSVRILPGVSSRTRLLALAGPLVVSFWLRSAFAWVDTIFASTLFDSQGESLGDASIAAIGLTLPFEFLLTACWVGSSNGLTARLAAAMGAGEGDRVEQLKRASRRIIHGLGVLFLALAAGIWIFAERVGLDPLVAHQFRIYATILIGGSAFTAFWAILPDSLVKAHHDTRSTMWAGVFSSITNVVLNAVFVFVFEWGMFGIALSTVLSRIAGLVYAVGRARAHEVARRLRDDQGRPGLFGNPVRSILSLSIPSAITYLLMAAEALAINGLLANQEDSTSLLAAWSIFDRSVRFLAMPLIAISVAMLPLAARLSGEGAVGALRRELSVGMRAGIIYIGVFVTPLALFLGPWVAHALSDSPATAEFGAGSMTWVPLAVFGFLPFLLARATFDGLQRPRPGLIASIVRAVVLVIPLAWLGMHFHAQLGVTLIDGACIGFGVGTMISGLGLWFWTTNKLEAECAAVREDDGALE